MSFRNEFHKLKNESLKVKLEYIFTYYWIPILTVAALLVILVSQMIHFATRKEAVLSGHFINAIFEQEDSERFLSDVSSKMNIEEKTSEISLSNSLLSSDDPYSMMAAHQLITAQIAAKSLDFLVGDIDTLSQYAYDESFLDIRTVLSTEQTAVLSPYFLFIDRAIIEQISQSGEPPKEFPDPTKPETMKKPMPFAVQIPENSEFDNVYFAQTTKAIAIAIICNGPNPTGAAQFIFLACESFQ